MTFRRPSWMWRGGESGTASRRGDGKLLHRSTLGAERIATRKSVGESDTEIEIKE